MCKGCCRYLLFISCHYHCSYHRKITKSHSLLSMYGKPLVMLSQCITTPSLPPHMIIKWVEFNIFDVAITSSQICLHTVDPTTRPHPLWGKTIDLITKPHPIPWDIKGSGDFGKLLGLSNFCAPMSIQVIALAYSFDIKDLLTSGTYHWTPHVHSAILNDQSDVSVPSEQTMGSEEATS